MPVMFTVISMMLSNITVIQIVVVVDVLSARYVLLAVHILPTIYRRVIKSTFVTVAIPRTTWD